MTGPGMERSWSHYRLFQALVKTSRLETGVGIGLYLAREIVTRQGGYIKVVSEPGGGSEFSIMLPTK